MRVCVHTAALSVLVAAMAVARASASPMVVTVSDAHQTYAHHTASWLQFNATMDRDGTLYCKHATENSHFTSADVKNTGSSHPYTGGSGPLTIIFMGVFRLRPQVACVGDDGAGQVSDPPAKSAAVTMDVNGPTLANVAGSHSGTTTTITGTSNDAGTVYCMLDDTGATVTADSVRSAGNADGVDAAGGSFSIGINTASPAGKSAFCVGTDGWGNPSAVATGPIGAPPTGMALSAATIAENSQQATDVGTLSTTDPDDGDTFTYTITSQSVTDAFQISDDKLQVGPGVLDFETSATIDVTVRSTDAGGLTFDKDFTITLTNVNEAPTGVALSAGTIAENSQQATDVGTLSTTDPDAGDTFTYTITSQSVADAFQIGDNKLQVGSGVLNFEASATIAVTVRSTDAGGLAFDKTFTITLTNVNDTPTGITLSATTVVENSPQATDVGTLSTTDPDAGDSFTYSITSQSVADAFRISGNKLQVGSGVVDFETSATIAVTVRSTDAGGLTFDKDFTITLTNVNEAPTDIALTSASIADDSTAQGSAVGTLSTTDPDAGDTFTYAITSQSVADAFQIQGGELQAGPSGASLATDAVVSVSVATTDAGGLIFTRAFDITVTETTNVTALAIIAAALTVVAGFTYAFYAHGKRVASAAVAKPAPSV